MSQALPGILEWVTLARCKMCGALEKLCPSPTGPESINAARALTLMHPCSSEEIGLLEILGAGTRQFIPTKTTI